MSEPPPFDPTTNKTLQILTAAEKGGYGVPAPIAYNLEHILAFTRAAISKRSPLILQFFPWAISFSSGLLIQTACLAASTAPVPIAIHLDHAQDETQIRDAAANLPFDSIMVDMSHYEKDENLARTKRLVEVCHRKGIAVEAEPGRIEGGEDGVSDTGMLEGVMTTKQDVEEFLATGVDLLAPAFGNVHGEYGLAGPRLDWERLDEVRECINGRVKIVLHGTNGFGEDVMKECVRHGTTKINLNKLVLQDYLDHLKDQAGKVTLTQLMEEGVEKAQKLLEWQMDVCGSTGKA